MDSKYVMIDTETTGLFDFSQPADAPGQPRMASFGAIELTEDLEIVVGCERYVKPDGWVMSKEASAVNGLTMDYLQEKGEPVQDILSDYAALVDAGKIIMAFNASYDLKILRGELRRAGMDDRFEKTSHLCVMKACTDVCRLPGKRGGYKWPKLEEACLHFGITQVDAHNCFGDCIDALKVAQVLRVVGRLPEPSIPVATS